MLVYLLQYINNRKQLFEEIKFVFPIKGHSYMPPHRVFGRIKREVRRKEIIQSPQGYCEIIRKFGRLKVLI